MNEWISKSYSGLLSESLNAQTDRWIEELC